MPELLWATLSRSLGQRFLFLCLSSAYPDWEGARWALGFGHSLYSNHPHPPGGLVCRAVAVQGALHSSGTCSGTPPPWTPQISRCSQASVNSMAPEPSQLAFLGVLEVLLRSRKLSTCNCYTQKKDRFAKWRKIGVIFLHPTLCPWLWSFLSLKDLRLTPSSLRIQLVSILAFHDFLDVSSVCLFFTLHI